PPTRRFGRRRPPLALERAPEIEPPAALRPRSRPERPDPAGIDERASPEEETAFVAEGASRTPWPKPHIPRRHRVDRTPPQRTTDSDPAPASDGDRLAPVPPRPVGPDAPPDAVTRAHLVPPEIQRRREASTGVPTGPLPVPAGRGAAPEERPRGRRAAARH